MQMHLCFDVAVGDFEARFKAAAHQAAPHHLRLELLLERGSAGATVDEQLCQPRCVDIHIGRNAVEGVVHVGFARVDAAGCRHRG